MFNGEDPRIWKDKAEKYFSMYGVPTHVWASFGTLNFRGNDSRWLQAYEAQHIVDIWAELCVVVEQKFGRELYQNHMRDILHIRQTGDVLEYANRFYEAKHRVLVHNRDLDEVFFVQKFLDGLNYNISKAIRLHTPRTVDAALSLALMQEDLLEMSQKRYQPRAAKQSGKHTDRTAIVSNLTTSAAGVLGVAPVEAKNAVNFKRDHKLSALMTQRKKMGLCMKCRDKWERGHKCPQHIPLHILEELLEVVQESSMDGSSSTDTSCDEELLSLSLSTTIGIQGKKTMRLQGNFKWHEILILVDSGSSSTFISASLVQKLACPTEPIEAATVIVAYGATLLCNTRVPDVTWCTQGHSFTMEARVLDLKHYDMVLGIDWLEDHSPMWVDRKCKRMRFTHK
jgi:hypothetical protein